MLYGLFVFNFHHYYYYPFLWIKHGAWNLSRLSVPPIRSHWTLSVTFHCGFSAETTPFGNVVNDYTIYCQCFSMHWCSKFMHGVQWRMSNTTHSFPPCQGRSAPTGPTGQDGGWSLWFGKGWKVGVVGGIFALATGKGGGHGKRMLKNEAGHIILNLAKRHFFSSAPHVSFSGLLYDEQQTA